MYNNSRIGIINNNGFDRICRICLTSDSKSLVCVLKNYSLKTKFEMCSSVNINLSEQMPSNICCECIDKIEIATKLREQIEAADLFLRNQLFLLSKEEEQIEYDKNFIESVPPFNIIKEEIKNENEGEGMLDENFDVDILVGQNSKIEANEPHMFTAQQELNKDDWLNNYKTERKRKKRGMCVTRRDEKREMQFTIFKDKKYNEHYKSILLLCDKCGKQVKYTAMANHRLTHEKSTASEDLEKRKDLFDCDKCKKRFTSSLALRRHNYKCNNNGKKKTPRKYYCDVCGKQMSTRIALHMRIHLGIRPFKCELCGKDFARKCALEKHMRSHTGETPFLCPYCKRAFTMKWNLTQHLRLHTSELPYKCQQCNQAYRHNVTLKQHLKNAHPTT